MATAGVSGERGKTEEAVIGQFHHECVDNANIQLRLKAKEFTHCVFTSRMKDAFVDTFA